MKKAKQKKSREKPFTVKVTERDIRESKVGDCFKCAVARAMQRDTGDDHANVYVQEWQLRLEVHGRDIEAPLEVCAFVRAYDDQRHDGNTRYPVLSAVLPDGLRPFEFTLPPLEDPAWRERCCHCEELFAPKELDDEGCCRACKEK